MPGDLPSGNRCLTGTTAIGISLVSFDLFTIQSAAFELNARLAGARIERAGFVQKQDGPRTQGGQPALAIACRRDFHLAFELGTRGIVSLPNAPMPAVFEMHGNGERYLQGAAVDSVRADRRDRVLRIRLTRQNRQGERTYGQLLVELIPPRVQAVLVAERSQSIKGIWPTPCGSGHGRRLREGGTYSPPGKTRLLPGEDSIDLFQVALAEELHRRRGNLPLALQRTIAGADRGVAAEILFRAGLPLHGKEPGGGLPALDDSLVRRLWKVGAEMFSETVATGGHLFTGEGRLMVSSMRPRRPVEDLQRFDSVLSAMAEWRSVRLRTEAKKAGFRLARQALARELRQATRSREAVERDLDETAEAPSLLQRGSLLLAHLNEVRPGTAHLELPNSFPESEAGHLAIELDLRFSPAENAARFLKRARKLEKRLQVLPERLRQVERLEKGLRRMLAGLETDSDELPADVRKWMEKRQSERVREKEGSARAHPRRYRTSGGWTVWVGRNQRENDQLTHRMASPEDLWFHASGYPGSHVVLRREGRKEEPGARNIEEAAGLAAYWSKGRSARKVPVVYTRVKHVSKPRGGAPGLAVLRREKTVMVVPMLLAIEDKEPK